MTSPNMSAQHIGRHGPALRTKPQDQQGQSSFLFAPNSNLLSFLEKVEPFCRYPLLTSSYLTHNLLDLKPFLCSAMTVSVFSNLGFIRCLNVLLLMLTGLSFSSPIRPPENHHRVSVGRAVGVNPLLDAQDFLSQFLSTLNLTELRPQARPLAGRKEPPEYMLELYNRYANDRTAVPSANVVRSFKNEGRKLVFCSTPRKSGRIYIMQKKMCVK